MRGRLWTPADDEQLRNLWGSDTFRGLAIMLDRTWQAVRRRGGILGLPHYRPAHRLWTREDIDMAVQMERQGMKSYTIARRLGRSTHAVQMMLLFVRGAKQGRNRHPS